MLWPWLMENKVDVISDVPSRIFTLLGAESFRRALKTYGKLVICGGEKYPDKLLQALKEVVPRPMNIYGPSEITISCNEHDLAQENSITVGKPTPGVTEYVVDTDGNELPVGRKMAIWKSSDARITKSSCGGCALSWMRWKACWPSSQVCGILL